MDLGSPQHAQDVVAYAAQVGRLDFLSAAVAVLATLIGVAAFPFWFFAHRRAEQVAKNAAEEALKGAVERAERAAISKMEELLPTLMQEYRELAANAVDADTANAIATAQDNGEVRPNREG